MFSEREFSSRSDGFENDRHELPLESKDFTTTFLPSATANFYQNQNNKKTKNHPRISKELMNLRIKGRRRLDPIPESSQNHTEYEISNIPSPSPDPEPPRYMFSFERSASASQSNAGQSDDRLRRQEAQHTRVEIGERRNNLSDK